MSKKVIITLQNPLHPEDLFDMTFTVNENEISHAWFDEVVNCLNLKQQAKRKHQFPFFKGQD